MRILIAGGAGFIGSRLAPALSSLGHDVTVLDLLWFGNHLPQSIEVIQKDVFDIDDTWLSGFDRVIFLAGVSNDPMAEYSPQINYIYNAAAPAYLSYIAKKAGVKKFIYGSSCSVYGNRGDGLSVEEDKVISVYPYGISKLQGEMAVMSIIDEHFSVISLRQGTVCGASPRARFDLVINTMYMKAMTEGAITVDHPAIWRPVLAISDAVNAYIKAIEADDQLSGIFNVSSFNTTVGELAKEVQKFVSKKYGKEIKINENRTKNFRNYRVSTAKAEKVLGVKFTGTPLSILEEIDAQFGEGADFNKDEYYNIRTFKKMIDIKKHLIN